MSRATQRLIGTTVAMGLLAGCAPGLISGDRQRDPNLHRVLVSDRDVPAKQGLLFMAMQDAEVAVQNAGYAVVADEPAESKARINNMLHAIDPSFPATPTVTASGIASFWPGTGFGLRRSVEGIAQQVRAGGSRPGASEQVVAQVTGCAEETLGRIDRITSLGQQALAAGSAAELAPLLAEIERQARIVMEAPAAQAAGACSLEDAKRHLDSLALQLA